MIVAVLLVLVAIPAELDDYLTALRHAEHGASIERAFDAAVAARTPLEKVLEKLSDEDFRRVAATRGLVIGRDEIIVVEPDPQFFLEMARKHGRAPDVAFFKEYARTHPGWPSYIEQITDYSGCTRYGAGELVARYAGWMAFQRAYRAYTKHVRAELDEIEDIVAQDTCACGDRDETLRELQEFATRFPRTSSRLNLRDRIRAIERGESVMRFHCHSG
jgi:hypothetical protein